MNKMINTLVTLFRINCCLTLNQLIYYFRRIPIIGTMLPDSAYGFGDLKLAATILIGLWQVLKNFLYKGIYLFLVLFLPLQLITEEISNSMLLIYFSNILLFLNIFIGSLGNSNLLENKPFKYICIKLMHMPAKQFALCSILTKQLKDLIGLLPFVLLFGALYDISAGYCIWLTLLIVMAHLVGEMIHLWIYQHTQLKLFEKWYVSGGIILIGCAGAYFPIVLYATSQTVFEIAIIAFHLTYHLLFLLILIGLYVLAIIYLVKFPHYKQLFSKILKMQSYQTAKETTNQARFKDVKLKDSDFNPDISKQFSHKTGYEYLNALFFARHRRMIYEPVRTRLFMIGICFIIVAVVSLIIPEVSAAVVSYLPKSLPVFVFIMYVISIGERVCRAMFNNCDISLLRYAYYRERNVLLQNFKIRLLQIIKLNIIIAAEICVGIAILSMICQISWAPIDMVLFMLTILCLSVFFSVHHLFLYYVFQPYTTDLAMKNPFFNIINGIVYFGCYICLQMDSTPKNFTWLVLIATVLYTIVALYLVYRYAPKNFRMKS